MFYDRGEFMAAKYNVIKNYTKKAPWDDSPYTVQIWKYSPQSISWGMYVEGNIDAYRSSDSMAQNLAVEPGSRSYLVSGRYPAPFITETSALQAYNDLLAEGGAGNSKYISCSGEWVNRRDAHDTRVVNHVKNGTGTIIDDPSEVGGYLTISPGTPCADSDHDGIPDVWESSHGLNASNAADNKLDADGDGYTNIEEYLNGTGTGTQPPTSDTTAPFVPSNLTAIAVSSSQINLSWNASTDNVGVAGYRIYRNGSQITTVTGTTYSNIGLQANTSYSYTVAAYDAAGNVSSQSSSVSATTQSQQGSETLCSVYQSGSSAPAGFGVPWNPYSSTKELIVKTLCGSNSLTVEAGSGLQTQYIYHYGYYYKNNQWNQFTFNCTGGAKIANAWCPASASATISGLNLLENNYIAAYICTWTGSEWKCGCRDNTCATPYWQLQSFGK